MAFHGDAVMPQVNASSWKEDEQVTSSPLWVFCPIRGIIHLPKSTMNSKVYSILFMEKYANILITLAVFIFSKQQFSVPGSRHISSRFKSVECTQRILNLKKSCSARHCICMHFALCRVLSQFSNKRMYSRVSSVPQPIFRARMSLLKL